MEATITRRQPTITNGAPTSQPVLKPAPLLLLLLISLLDTAIEVAQLTFSVALVLVHAVHLARPRVGA